MNPVVTGGGLCGSVRYEYAGEIALPGVAIALPLRVLEGAGVVCSVRVGRESRFEPKPLDHVRADLDHISRQRDSALARLRAFAEEDSP